MESGEFTRGKKRKLENEERGSKEALKQNIIILKTLSTKMIILKLFDEGITCLLSSVYNIREIEILV